MCLICVDFQKGSLTATEAWRNLQEMKEGLSDEHHDEVVEMITEKLLEMEEEITEDIDISNILDNLPTDYQLELDLETKDEWDDLVNFGENETSADWMVSPFED